MPKARDETEAGRINVYVEPTTRQMLRELAAWWHPNRKRVEGMIIERLIRDAYEQEVKKRG